MEIILPVLAFAAGAAIVFFYYRTRIAAIRDGLMKKINKLKNGNSKESNAIDSDSDSDLNADFSVVWNQIKALHENKQVPENKTTADQSVSAAELKKVIDHLGIINELGQRITSSLNLQQSFNHLYQTINSMMDAAVLELDVYDEHNDSFRLFTNCAYDENHYTNHVADWSRKNRREVLLSDMERDYARYVFEPLKMPDGKPVKSIMVFPVNYNDKITGTLSVISFKKNSFDFYHQEIIRSLLGYISVAINNALTHEELERTKVRAEQSEKFKEQFLANMSHEIRTPINAVTGMTRILLEKQPRTDQLRYLESIRNASDSLLVIINDILDLSKIEAGKIELEQIDFSVNDVIRNVREIMHFKAEEKGLFLDVKDDSSIPPVLTGDPTRLSQILINLVGNAIKFTEKGSVLISVKQHGNSNGQEVNLTFEVSDTGIGMTEEQQNKLFRDYAQASSETSRKYGGTGLGLSISRQLVQLQGGSISVASKPGAGSTFTFSLTYPVSKNKLIAIREQSVSGEMLAALKGIRVLLVDDNEYNRIVAKETLQLKVETVQVEEAVDGLMAVEMIQKGQYDVVLMDMVMPQMDGVEATRYIRTNLKPPQKNIPIVALTASVIKSEIDKCMDAGMNGFIPKPFKPNELLGAIYNALRGKGPIALKEQDMPEKYVETNASIVDLNYLNEFTEGDQVRLRRFIDLFLAKVPGSIQSLQEALQKGDYEKIRLASHSMKPQLRFTGVLQGLELAETIEQCCQENTGLDQLPSLIAELSSVCDQAIAELKKAVAE